MENQDTLGLLIIILLIPFVFGIIQGWQNKIVVFRNYDDLWLAFLAVCAPFIFIFMSAAFESQLVLIAGGVLELLLIVYVIQRTYVDNAKNIGVTILALYTKIPLCGLFVLQLLSYLNDISKPLYRRRHALTTLISLILLVPLINKLVKEKHGFLR